MAIIKQLLNTFHKRERVADLLCILEGYDGYKRESAARRLGLLGDPTAIPKLIVRVNDWVPQVRDTAREALLRLLVPENAFVFAENLPQIYHLEHCGRDNHEEIIQRVIDFLVLPENKQVLQNAVLSEKPKVARAAVNLLLQHFSEDMEKTVLNCLQHPDVMVRSIAADQFRHFSQNNLPSVLEIAINIFCLTGMWQSVNWLLSLCRHPALMLRACMRIRLAIKAVELSRKNVQF